MFLDRLTAETLSERVKDPGYFDQLADREQELDPRGERPSENEIGAWRAGLPLLAEDLLAIGRGGVECFVEYALLADGVQADVLLSGRHPETGEPSYVVVELKRWRYVTVDPARPNKCRSDSDAIPPYKKKNPVFQVRDYCSHLLLCHDAVTAHPERLAGIAYLHDAKMADVAGINLLQSSAHGQLFTADTREGLRTVLAGRFAAEADTTAGDDWEAARLGSRIKLEDKVRAELTGVRQFRLDGNQSEAYHAVLRAVEARLATGRKQVVIITGGPGTGKSAIATRLLDEFHQKDLPVALAVASSAYRKVIAGAAPRGTKYLLKSPGAYKSVDPDVLGVLICDEAHRIQANSVGMYGSGAERAAARPQVDELVDAAKVSVFLLDEHQAIRPGDVGSVDVIRAAAHRAGADVAPVIDLDGAFRCGGSKRYSEWVHRFFDLTPNSMGMVWRPDDLMDVRTADDMYQMTLYLRDKQARGDSARITAGYTWPWHAVNDDGSLPVDIVLEDGWARPWNALTETSRNGVPGRSVWAVADGGFEQVGCIYTAQGLEYDWAGVLMGRDLVRRGDRWVSQPEASFDRMAKRGARQDGGAAFHRCVRNTYKVLFTRGLRGVVIHSVDAETQAYLEHMVNANLGRWYHAGRNARRTAAPLPA